ncbi:hypothetical protein T492DRAFT_869129 [Pavlovales sp. CCMP2436]|nr:hypothetical protein T492DRAFT_869129 [Pavlovales sp. CCMP2436]
MTLPLALLEAAAEAALPPLLRALAGDPLRAILKLIGGVDLTCVRLACRDFRDHSSPAQEAIRRSGFLRTRALVVFAWERMPGFVLDRWLMLRLAASVGCVGALEELVDNRQCELAAGACAAAAETGQLGALTCLHSRGCPWDRDTCRNSAVGGHLEVLQYAHEHGCPWNSFVCVNAAFYGHLEYAHEHGCPWESDTCYEAATRGHLEVLRYTHEHGCPWDSDICSGAAQGGHLEVVQCLHEHGCPWDSFVCYKGAVGGHLEVLRYAHEHGCPMDVNECGEAAEAGGHAAVLEYLRAEHPEAREANAQTCRTRTRKLEPSARNPLA